MNRLFWTLLIAFVCLSSAKAQDLLVTIHRDTLNCKMGKMKNDHYPVTFILDGEETRGLIHKDSVLFFKKDVFRGMGIDRLRPWYPFVELGFDAGVAHQFGKFRMDDDLTDKSEFGAKTGFCLGTDLTYYVSQRIGYGLKYNYRSLLGGDIRYQYIGAVVTFRFLEKNKSGHLFFSISGGYGWMVQKNAPVQLFEMRPRIEMQAHSLSADFAVGYGFRLSKQVSVRVKASCNIAYPEFIRIEDLSHYASASDANLAIGDYCQNMNTFNLTAGFSFHK